MLIPVCYVTTSLHGWLVKFDVHYVIQKVIILWVYTLSLSAQQLAVYCYLAWMCSSYGASRL